MRKYKVIPEKDYTDFSSRGLRLENVKMTESVTTKPSVIPKLATILATGALYGLLPTVASASGVDTTFGNIHAAVMRAFDAGVVVVVIFAGAAWGLGHRSKAIEILIGVCCGYLLARHAVDIRDFLKTI